MSIYKVYPKEAGSKHGSLINPTPRRISSKKYPPLLVKLNLTNSLLKTPEHFLLNLKVNSTMRECKGMLETLPVTKSRLRSNRFTKYVSPNFRLDCNRLKPLFNKKKKVDQSLNTKLESFDMETDLQYESYKISVDSNITSDIKPLMKISP